MLGQQQGGTHGLCQTFALMNWLGVPGLASIAPGKSFIAAGGVNGRDYTAAGAEVVRTNVIIAIEHWIGVFDHPEAVLNKVTTNGVEVVHVIPNWVTTTLMENERALQSDGFVTSKIHRKNISVPAKQAAYIKMLRTMQNRCENKLYALSLLQEDPSLGLVTIEDVEPPPISWWRRLLGLA